MVLIKAFPRLHIGLLDLGHSTGRRFGGAGFMLDWSPIQVTANPGKSCISGLSLLDSRGRNDILAAMKRMKKTIALSPLRLALKSTPPQHIGFGTKTAIILALLRVAAAASGSSVSIHYLQELSGRGGASGVGIHGFFRGGFIVDAGQVDCNDDSFLPSSATRPNGIPPLVTRIKIPKHWQFVLFLPSGIRYSSRREVQFFQDNTPIPGSEIRDTIAVLYHGIVPAVLEAKVDDLGKSLSHLHCLGFKRRERDGQSASVRRLINELTSLSGCAVGMSSMGPLVYAVVDSPTPELIRDLMNIAQRQHARVLGVCSGRNNGYELS